MSPCLFNFYAEDIMKKARLDEVQPGIKIAKRNISHLRYADDITLMAESEEDDVIQLLTFYTKVKYQNLLKNFKLAISSQGSFYTPLSDYLVKTHTDSHPEHVRN